MDLPQIRFELPVGAQPYIDSTEEMGTEQRGKGMENIKK